MLKLTSVSTFQGELNGRNLSISSFVVAAKSFCRLSLHSEAIDLHNRAAANTPSMTFR